MITYEGLHLLPARNIGPVNLTKCAAAFCVNHSLSRNRYPLSAVIDNNTEIKCTLLRGRPERETGSSSGGKAVRFHTTKEQRYRL